MWAGIVDSVLFTILYPVTLLIAVILGYGIARKFYVRQNKEWKASGVEASVIGIFALLLSFTFLSSNNSMKDRLKTLHETSDAAANLRRESLFLSNDIKEATKQYLISYLDILGNFKTHYLAGENKLIGEIEFVNGNYLSLLISRNKLNPEGKQEVQLLLPYFNELNAHFYRTFYSYDERTPNLIIILLIVSSWLIALLVGFLNGFHQRRHYLVPFIFIVMVTLCIQAIRDLDNPHGGTIEPEFADFLAQQHSLINSTR